MPNFRRRYVPGGAYFFTVRAERGGTFLCDDLALPLIKQVYREMNDVWPVETIAMVVLPDHLHAMWTLPAGDAKFPARWGWFKKEFTKRWLAAGGCELPTTAGRHHDRRRAVWQPKYWEHAIRDEDDLIRHVEYVHYNPVKHGYVKCPADWPHSTFHRYVREGIYPADWCCLKVDGSKPPDFTDIEKRVGE